VLYIGPLFSEKMKQCFSIISGHVSWLIVSTVYWYNRNYIYLLPSLMVHCIDQFDLSSCLKLVSLDISVVINLYIHISVRHFNLMYTERFFHQVY